MLTPVLLPVLQPIARSIYEVYGRGSFSPASLFTGGFQGAWYDPSDMSTLFQDSAGSTPVTALEQPVGRINDKSGNGNHATQATTSLKPTYSARKNFLTYSEDLTQWALIGTAPTLTSNVAVAPDGATTADRLAYAASGQANRIQIFSSQTYTGNMVVSVYLRGEVGGEQITLWDGQGITTNCVLTTSWQRFQVTNSYSNQSVNCLLYATTGAPTVYAWGAQLEGGSVAGTYQRTTTASNYDDVGFPRYLRFDGVDDFMATAAFAFGSDKASIFTGVLKNPISSNAFWVDFGGNALNAFSLGSINPTTPLPIISARASGSQYSAYSTTSFSGNVFTVHSGLVDVVGGTLNSTFKRRTNGVELALTQNDAGPIGTGNFGTYALRLGGTVGLHNGALSQVVVVNKIASAAEITNSETFIATKSGVTL